MLLNVVLEKTLESSLDCKEIQPVHPKGNQSWIFFGRTYAEAETPILWPLIRRIDSLGKTLMLGKIKGRRRRGQQRMRFWMASLTQWTWVLVNSRSWWWIGRPGVLPFMGSQWVGHDWATELNWIPPNDYEESWKLFTLSPYYSNLSLFSELLGVIWQKMVVPVKKIKMTLHDKSGGVLTTTT